MAEKLCPGCGKPILARSARCNTCNRVGGNGRKERDERYEEYVAMKDMGCTDTQIQQALKVADRTMQRYRTQRRKAAT